MPDLRRAGRAGRDHLQFLWHASAARRRASRCACGGRAALVRRAGPAAARPPAPAAAARTSPSSQRTAASPENFVPSRARGTQFGGDEAPYIEQPTETEAPGGRGIFGLLGYVIAAI